MTLGERFRNLRRELGMSQEAFGAKGLISAPGWIKIENDQRQASEKLIEQVVAWLAKDKLMRPGAIGTLKEELLTLKYVGSTSKFVRDLAKAHAKKYPNNPNMATAAAPGSSRVKRRRGRPPGATYPKKK